MAASAAAVLDGTLYVVGGCETNVCGKTTVQSYDPAEDTWTARADYPEEVAWQSCGAIGGKLYCAGGLSDNTGITDAVYAYDPATDSWTALAPMPTALWGAGFTAAGGQLLVSGGNTAEGITNIGFVYNAQANSWQPLPNSSQVVRRGASACGLYRIGGSTGDFTGVAAAELLPGYDACGGDVPWLALSSDQFTLDPGEKQTVTVTLDAAAVSQPGTYTGSLTIGTDAGDVIDAVRVTMKATAPKKWGKITGVVTTARCTGSQAPLEGATVVLSSGDESRTLKTGSDGRYELWLDQQHNPVTVIAGKDGWRADAAVVKIKKGENVTRSFALDPYPFCPRG
ncbi:kelch repeat-containing protein [Streptomyces sp. NPDC058534]|uniref:Kelch repeat-containing protein n=1 Tax=Streptomyces sp. NPDC058534 TaxID=3346541 RepID=UPI003647996D